MIRLRSFGASARCGRLRGSRRFGVMSAFALQRRLQSYGVMMIGLVLAGCASNEPDTRGIVHKSYSLKLASADFVAQKLTAEEKGTADHRVVIVPDPRLNAVVVRGTPEDHVRLVKRIRELDVP